ncbi:hypothetical protein [Sansalvadorimonas verongulae]|uniref:hypothetical protein n=1 Tax=Sansalvadorimonas verongulae TaxID=2172824 RepID=UPI0012BB9125|nr:hypothetical protein [Sansalvadorimonas verongulae]MTI14805.1 hypothetical protein [Sansalvadorimonas verongulae]
MSTPSGIGPGGIQPSGHSVVDNKNDSEVTVRASLGNSARSLSLSSDTVSLKEQQSVDPENSVGDKSLSERSVEDVTDEKPGRMKQAMSWLKGKTFDKGAVLVRGAVNFAQHPMHSTGNALYSAGQYAKGKYQGAKEAGAAAKEQVGGGLSALKENPKEALKAGAASVGTGIKKRATTLPGKVKKLVPSRSKGFNLSKLSKLKSVFSRSAKGVPPAPSASVKHLVATAGQKQDVQRAQGAERQDVLQQTREARDNTQNLNKLLSDPVSLSRSSEDFTLRFPGGEVVDISGTAAERAQSTRDAVGFANKYRSEIQQNKGDFEQLTKDLKTENRKADKADRKTATRERNAIAHDEQRNFKKDAETLKSQRSEIKDQISKLKAEIKEELKVDKESIKQQKAPLKTTLKADRELLKTLEKSVEGDQKQLDNELKELRAELKTARKGVKKFEGKLERERPEWDQQSAQSGLASAQGEVGRLVDAMTAKQQAFDVAHRDVNQDIADLRATVEQEKIDLKGDFEVADSRVGRLRQQLAETEALLEGNTKQMKELQRQHKAAREEIKKLK